MLVDFKNKGGLIKSSVSITKVVKFVEKRLMTTTNNYTSIQNSIHQNYYLYQKICL